MTPFTKQSELAHQPINDDDLYVIDLSSRSIVEHLGCKTIMSMAIRAGNKWGVAPGQALVTGIKARALLEVVA